jgi:hypothetical protein
VDDGAETGAVDEGDAFQARNAWAWRAELVKHAIGPAMAVVMAPRVVALRDEDLVERVAGLAVDLADAVIARLLVKQGRRRL